MSEKLSKSPPSATAAPKAPTAAPTEQPAPTAITLFSAAITEKGLLQLSEEEDSSSEVSVLEQCYNSDGDFIYNGDDIMGKDGTMTYKSFTSLDQENEHILRAIMIVMETDVRFGKPHVNPVNFVKLHWYCFHGGILLNDNGEPNEGEASVGPCQNHFSDYPEYGPEPRHLLFKRHIMGAIKLFAGCHDAVTYQGQHNNVECPEAYFSKG